MFSEGCGFFMEIMNRFASAYGGDETDVAQLRSSVPAAGGFLPGISGWGERQDIRGWYVQKNEASLKE
jgi:hypothetical protein